MATANPLYSDIPLPCDAPITPPRIPKIITMTCKNYFSFTQLPCSKIGLYLQKFIPRLGDTWLICPFLMVFFCPLSMGLVPLTKWTKRLIHGGYQLPTKWDDPPSIFSSHFEDCKSPNYYNHIRGTFAYLPTSINGWYLWVLLTHVSYGYLP